MSAEEAKVQTLESAQPIFAIKRGKIREIVVHAWTGFGTGSSAHREQLFSTGLSARSQLIARSLLKPWQFWATGLAEGAASSELALGLASQSAQPHQLAALKNLHEQKSVNPELLQCPALMPMDRKESERLRSLGIAKSRLFHPCAGKHSFVLAACLRNQWPTDSYLDHKHPLQMKLNALLHQRLPHARPPISWETDSCGLPSAVLDFSEHLDLWFDLATSLEPTAQLIRKLWELYPEYIGGHHRIDTEIVIASKGCVMSKEGAEGLLVIQDATGPNFATSLVKIASGYNAPYMALASLAVLKKQEHRLSPAMKNVLLFLESRAQPGGDWVAKDQSFEVL